MPRKIADTHTVVPRKAGRQRLVDRPARRRRGTRSNSAQSEDLCILNEEGEADERLCTHSHRGEACPPGHGAHPQAGRAHAGHAAPGRDRLRSHRASGGSPRGSAVCAPLRHRLVRFFLSAASRPQIGRGWTIDGLMLLSDGFPRASTTCHEHRRGLARPRSQRASAWPSARRQQGRGGAHQLRRQRPISAGHSSTRRSTSRRCSRRRWCSYSRAPAGRMDPHQAQVRHRGVGPAQRHGRVRHPGGCAWTHRRLGR